MDTMHISSEKLTGILSDFLNKKIKKSGHAARVSIKEVKAISSLSGVSFGVAANIDIPYSELIKILTEGD